MRTFDQPVRGFHDRARHNVVAADEFRDLAIGRAPENLLRRADLLDAAVIHDDHPIGHGKRFRLMMGDVDEGDFELAMQPHQLSLHAHAQMRIERTERFVKQEHLRLDGKRARQRYALTLAAGKLVDGAIGEFGDAQGGSAIRPP